jgi:hypothetical protein
MPVVAISEFQADYQDTERSTEQTVRAMCQHIREAAGDPEVNRAVAAAVQQFPQWSDSPSIAASCCWHWCKRHIEFVTDEEQLGKLLGRQDELELLISPSVMVRTRVRRGDCDCFTMMLCAMLQSLGITPLIKTFKCDRSDPSRWSHVCAAAVVERGEAMTLDASHGNYAGWEVPSQDVYAWRLWDMDGNVVGGSMDRRGLSGYTPEPGWRGAPGFSVGSVAGPYANRDFPTAYGSRSRKLRSIADSKFRGMGQVDDGITVSSTPIDTSAINALIDSGLYTDTSAGVDPSTGLSLSTGTGAAAPSSSVVYINSDGSVSTTPTSSSSTATTLGLLSALIPAAAKLTSQAIATPGTILLPNGTIAVGTAAGTPSIASSIGTSLSSALSGGGILWLLVALGVILVIEKK